LKESRLFVTIHNYSYAGFSIRIAGSANNLKRPWRQSATWVLLCLYLLTGPVMESLHAGHDFPRQAPSSVSDVRPAGRERGHFPPDQTHTCVLCTQLTVRLTTPPAPFRVSSLRLITVLAVPAGTGRLVPLRYLTPDKRGPPLAFA
jgi:hypothetical protein